MIKVAKCQKRNIALLTVSGIVFIISALMLISSVRYLTNMLKSQEPIDSFGTVDFAVTLVVIFSILTIASAIGLIVGALKFKNRK